MLGLFLAVAFAFTPQDADNAYTIAREFVTKCTPRDAGSIRGKVASNYILDKASMSGADMRRDVFTAKTPKGMQQFVNLYCDFQADADSRWVVLVSHYDTKPGVACPGANDGASTSALLIALARALCDWKTPKGNVMLVWTDGEECQASYGENDGFWGSKRAVEYIQSKNRQIQAVLCLDMLGDRDLSISIPANGSEALAKIALHAADRAGLPGLVKRIPELVKDDHVAFLDAGYKAIDLIDFEYGPGNSYWHTEKDTMENVSRDSLYKSGKLVAELLNILL